MASKSKYSPVQGYPGTEQHSCEIDIRRMQFGGRDARKERMVRGVLHFQSENATRRSVFDGCMLKVVGDVPDHTLAKPVEVVHNKAGAQVRGNAVKTAAVHNPDALLLSSGMVLVQDVPHPDDLP